MLRTAVLSLLVASTSSASAQIVHVEKDKLQDHFRWRNWYTEVDVAFYRWARKEKKVEAGWWVGERGRVKYQGYLLNKKYADWDEVDYNDAERAHKYAKSKGYLTAIYNGEYKKPTRGLIMIEKDAADLIWAPVSEVSAQDAGTGPLPGRRKLHRWASKPGDDRPAYDTARYVGPKKEFSDGPRRLVVAFPKGGKR